MSLWDILPDEAMADADIVCTDAWPKEHKEAFRKFQVTKRRMELARPGALFNPCPPFTRGEEVSEDVIDSAFLQAIPSRAVCWRYSRRFCFTVWDMNSDMISCHIRKIVTVPPAPFAKPRYALSAASQLSLLINGRSLRPLSASHLFVQARQLPGSGGRVNCNGKYLLCG